MSLYWQSMHLEYDPFMAEQANQTPFVFPKWEQQLNLLVHLATSQDSMLLVLGVSGIGKSTMMRQFIENLGHSGGICKIHGGATITIEVLQDLIARHLGFTLSQQDPEQFSSQLLERIGRMRAEGHDFYLVIDNAHKLPKASLGLLLELVEIQGGDHHPIHTILFGGPQLEAVIGEITSQHLGEVLTHSLHLEPLSIDYLKHYVEQRLKLAGFSDALPFTQNQLQQIYQISGGVPAKVNSLARQLLLQWTQQSNKKAGDKHAHMNLGHRQKNKDKNPLSVYWYGGAALAVIAVVFAVMYHFNSANTDAVGNQTLMVSSNKANVQQDYDEAGSESASNHVVAQANRQVAAVSSVPDSSYTQVDSNGDASVGSDSNSANAQAQSSQDNATSSVSSVGSSNPASDNTDSTADQATSSDGMINSDDDTSSVGSAGQTQASNSGTHQTVNQALADNAALTKPAAPASSNAQAMGLSTQAVPAPSMTQAKPVSHSSLVSSGAVAAASVQSAGDAEYIPPGGQIPLGQVATPAPVPAIAPKAQAAVVKTSAKVPATSAKAVKSAPSKSHAGLDTSYFQAQPASRVGLQIAGSRDEAKLKQQVAAYGLTGQVHYFKTVMNGAPWYVAVYGNYPSIASATSAKANLPASVQVTKPWPRSFQSIQSAIHLG